MFTVLSQVLKTGLASLTRGETTFLSGNMTICDSVTETKKTLFRFGKTGKDIKSKLTILCLTYLLLTGGGTGESERWLVGQKERCDCRLFSDAFVKFGRTSIPFSNKKGNHKNSTLSSILKSGWNQIISMHQFSMLLIIAGDIEMNPGPPKATLDFFAWLVKTPRNITEGRIKKRCKDLGEAISNNRIPESLYTEDNLITLQHCSENEQFSGICPEIENIVSHWYDKVAEREQVITYEPRTSESEAQISKPTPTRNRSKNHELKLKKHYECSECGKVFSRNQTCKAHIGKLHPNAGKGHYYFLCKDYNQ